MPYAIPIKLYEELENAVGRDKARIIAESLEESIKNTFKEEQLKTEIKVKEDLKNELVTKVEFDLKIDNLKKEIELVRKEIDLVRKENRIFYITIIFLMIILNPDAREFLFKLFTFYK
ncbi:MAG: hypothetical protein N3F62_01230 [Bacteroidia bacterium]|jgi:hypothetical protein|nr:hypothetical protein [Bacteroidia bacterium]